MRLIKLARATIRGWFRHDVVAGEIHEEMQFHLRMREDELRGQGLAPDEAKRAAIRRFGSLALMEDRGYDVRGGGFVETVIQDVRYALRVLYKQRGFSVVAILTVALGIGVSTALFSVIDAAVLRPVPYPHPEELVLIDPEETGPDGRTSRPTPSMADMRLWQQADDVFLSVAGWGNSWDGRIVDDPEPERLQVLEFTEDYLSMHGVTPIIGRGFTRADMDLNAPLVAILGYGYWQRHYGGREDIVGASIRFDDGAATIVGVLPASFNASTPVSLPLRIPAAEVARRGTGRPSVYGRLRPDVTIAQARDRLAARMAAEPGPGRVARARVTSRLETLVSRNRTTINVLAGAVGLVLLIACVNVAGLLLARGATRHAELAVRASLGAGRLRLMRQMLTESLVLAFAGGLLGVLLARLSLSAIVANIPFTVSSNSPVSINLTVLLATTALLVPTTLIFGLVPAIRLSRVQIGAGLAHGSRQTGSLSRRGGQTLIAAEVAIAVVLLASAGLMTRSFLRITAVDLGFNPEGLITMEVLPLDKNPSVHDEFYPALLRQIRTIPGATSVGVVDNFALSGTTAYEGVTVAGESVGSTAFETLPGYLETIGARLRDGRLPTDGDHASGLRSAVINESAARAMFHGRRAVGQEFTRPGEPPQTWTVLGVIDDIRHTGPLNMRDPNIPEIFYPFEPEAWNLTTAMVVVLRPSITSPDLGMRLRQAAQSIGPRVLVERVRSSDDWFADRVATPRRRLVLLSLLGGLGLALVIVGIAGLTAYAVARRTTEIGVRMAFGAQPANVVLQMVRDAALPVLVGLAGGLGGAYYGARVIESFLYETTPHDPWTPAAVLAVVGVAAILAALIPALRAARVDPVVALRAE